MSKYFDGYAKFDYKEMSKEKLITELKEKVRYIGELKRNNDKEIAKVQSIKDKTIADLEAKLTESEKEKERIKKNWRISRTQQQKLYENLKQENKKAGVVNYPIVLDGCRISNEEQLLDFAKDFVLEKAYWQQQLAEKEKEISNLRGLVNERDKQIKNLKTNKKRVIEHKNNVKISFAVEQIMQIREKIDKSQKIGIGLTLDGIYEIDNIFDNQIAQLTNQHENKGE